MAVVLQTRLPPITRKLRFSITINLCMFTTLLHFCWTRQTSLINLSKLIIMYCLLRFSTIDHFAYKRFWKINISHIGLFTKNFVSLENNRILLISITFSRKGKLICYNEFANQWVILKECNLKQNDLFEPGVCAQYSSRFFAFILVRYLFGLSQSLRIISQITLMFSAGVECAL